MNVQFIKWELWAILILGDTNSFMYVFIECPASFNVKTVSPTYIAHFLAQDFSHFLRVFLVGVSLFAP